MSHLIVGERHSPAATTTAWRPAGLDECLRDVEAVEEAVARVLHVHHRGAVAAERDLHHVRGRGLGDVVRRRGEDQEVDVAGLDARGRHRAFRGPRGEVGGAHPVGRVAPLDDAGREADDALRDPPAAAALVDARLDHVGGPHVVGHIAARPGDQGSDTRPVLALRHTGSPPNASVGPARLCPTCDQLNCGQSEPFASLQTTPPLVDANETSSGEQTRSTAARAPCRRARSERVGEHGRG